MTWEERYKLLQEFCESALISEYNSHGKGDPDELITPFAQGVAKCLMAAKIIADGEIDSADEENRIAVLLVKMVIVLSKMSKGPEPKCGADIGAQKNATTL